MPRQGTEHARGPYRHGNRFRVVFVAANGAEQTLSYATLGEAEAERDAFNRMAGNRSLGEAVRDYLELHKQAKGYETIRHRLYAMLRVVEGDRPLHEINEAEARKLYQRRTSEVAVATHHGELRYASLFFDHAVSAGWVRINPFANVEKIGTPNRGKPKLRVTATKKYLEALMHDGSMEATAVLMALTFALRASAVVDRTVADLDDDGRILWVRGSKTAASDMEIEVPEFLRVRLLKLAEGKPATAKLFGEMTRHALHYHTVRLCKVAGVDRVTPHGLRGSGATHAVRSGQAIEQVARQIGHADKGVTLKNHYLGGGAIESGHARAIEALVPAQKAIEASDDAHTELN